MKYKYGTFSPTQIQVNIEQIHNEIHRLLLYKDSNVTNEIFANDHEFFHYFDNLLYRYGGMNKIFGEPKEMVAFISTLQAAYDIADSTEFSFKDYRRMILNAHSYVDMMFGGE